MRIPARAVIATSRAAGRVGGRWLAHRVRNPVFIVGCGRSGTTLLNHLFDRHPEVANYPAEANELWHPRLYPWRRAQVDAPPFWVDPVAFTRISLAGRTEADDRLLLGTFAAFQTLARRRLFLNKTVMVTFMLDKVLALFPSAKLVHLYRDGRAVALSMLVKEAAKVSGSRYAEKGYRYERDALLDMYAKHWQDHILALAEADRRHGLTGRGRLFELSYEGLCRDPHTTVVALADYLGISAAPFTSGDLAGIRNTNYKSKQSLSADALARLNRLAAPGLAAKAYGAEIA